MNLITRIMAKLNNRYFKGAVKPDGTVEQPPLELLEIIEALKRYKLQNPEKYAAKKAALFARYGLNDEEAVAVEEEVKDPEIEELEVKAAKAKTKKNAA